MVWFSSHRRRHKPPNLFSKITHNNLNRWFPSSKTWSNNLNLRPPIQLHMHQQFIIRTSSRKCRQFRLKQMLNLRLPWTWGKDKEERPMEVRSRFSSSLEGFCHQIKSSLLLIRLLELLQIVEILRHRHRQHIISSTSREVEKFLLPSWLRNNNSRLLWTAVQEAQIVMDRDSSWKMPKISLILLLIRLRRRRR